MEYIAVCVLVGISCVAVFKSLGSEYKCRVQLSTARFFGDGKAAVAGCSEGPIGPLASAGGDTPGSAGPVGPTPGVTCVGTACTRPNSCFVAGTLVLTEQGLRPIETLAAGDRVWARPDREPAEAPPTDEAGALAAGDDWRAVTETFVSRSRSLVRLTIAHDGASDGETLELTPNHRLFVDGRGFIEARALEPARDRLRDAAGAPLTVVAVESVDAQVPVFNLEVDGYHTYFVGAHGLWVHNGLPAWFTLNNGRNPIGKRIPITLPDGRKGEALIVGRNADGSYEFEVNVGGDHLSGTVNRKGKVSGLHPLPAPNPWKPGSTIAGLPVTQLPNGNYQVGNNIIIQQPEINQTGNPRNHDPPRTVAAKTNFQSGTLNNLNTLADTPAGQALLHDLDSGGHPVTIGYGDGYFARANTESNAQGNLQTNSSGQRVPGAGTSSTISYNAGMYGSPIHEGTNDPALQTTEPPRRGANVSSTDAAVLPAFQGSQFGRASNKPPWITLGHELTHAADKQRGLNDKGSADPPAKGQPGPESQPEIAEQRTSGLGDFSGLPYNENAYRQQSGLPPRDWYKDPNESYPSEAGRGYAVPQMFGGAPPAAPAVAAPTPGAPAPPTGSCG